MTYELPLNEDGTVDLPKLWNCVDHSSNPEVILKALTEHTRAEIVDACIAEATRVFARGSAHHSHFRNGWNEACRDIADRLKGLKP